MKPSKIRKTNSHEEFAKYIYEYYIQIEKESIEFDSKYNSKFNIEIEAPLYNGKYLVGVADALIIITRSDGKIIADLIEFKPNTDDITAAIRQLKIYKEAIKENYNYVTMTFCTYHNKINKDQIDLLLKTGIRVEVIKN